MLCMLCITCLLISIVFLSSIFVFMAPIINKYILDKKSEFVFPVQSVSVFSQWYTPELGASLVLVFVFV